MALHKDLTGTDLHEPKGVASASIDTIYVANGAGSGSWVKIDSANIDTTSILNTNKFQLSVKVTDLASVSFVLVPVVQNCTLTAATSVITAAITGADAVLTFTRAGASTIGTITIDDSGSGEGVIDTLSSPVNNTFTAPSYVKIACDGGPSGGTSDAYIVLEFTLT